MSTDQFAPAADQAHQAQESANDAADHGQKALREAIAAAERVITDAAKAGEKALKDAIETLRAQTRAYGGNAGQHIDEAQRYVTERVKEKPMTATLAGLGVGVLLGLLLSSRSK
jgi:ElaB/YqjD/DUF883 family membrane-anchored ribosome-binding protein